MAYKRFRHLRWWQKALYTIAVLFSVAFFARGCIKDCGYDAALESSEEFCNKGKHRACFENLCLRKFPGACIYLECANGGRLACTALTYMNRMTYMSIRLKGNTDADKLQD